MYIYIYATGPSPESYRPTWLSCGHQVPHYFRYGGLCDLSYPEEHGRQDQHDDLHDQSD